MTERFKREYSTALALRPSQLRATASDGALMMSDAKELSARYGELSMPVAIVAGNGDKVVSPDHAERLRGAVPDATLRIVEGAGHMVHHVATEQVVEAIEEVARRAGAGLGGASPRPPSGGGARARSGLRARTAPINATEASARAALVASVAPDEIERWEAPLGA